MLASGITVNMSLFYISHTTFRFVGLSVIMVSRDNIRCIETKLRAGRSGVRIQSASSSEPVRLCGVVKGVCLRFESSVQ